MAFKQNVLNARHHLVFLLGLGLAFTLVMSLEQQEFNNDLVDKLHFSATIPDPQPRPLTVQERQWAETAWQYFEANTQTGTGLANSVDGYPSTTMWDTASYLMAIIAAERLQLISRHQFSGRLSKLLSSLGKMPLFDDVLPNKVYDTRSLAMVNYDNTPNPRGIGWSAIDIGRLLVPFNILVWQYPEFTPQVQQVLGRWNLQPMLQDGVMFGARVTNELTEFVQEGRIGYEEYASKSLSLMGQDLSQALRYTDFLQMVEIDGVQVPTDKRDPRRYKAHNYVVSESYILDGLEFGWDRISHEFAWRVYQAQKARFERTGILTAVSEDNIDRPPYFVYNTVFSSGQPWHATTDTGEDASEFRSLSTKAAFGWYALYQDDYSQQLLSQAAPLTSPDRGFYSGWYEQLQETNTALTANTNGIVLESLLYIREGKLLNVGRQQALVQLAVQEE
ncbi:DUF3131 domain-containing protein [Ferrimonas sp. SCSIO 43195]|uniref:DUF3131 domain-containing protein n=1 Tax=Ferrimonas sp. SCSIO 43195 TaxID=2822844 RepID=UPI002075B3F7|nr:DUF3131 domain-containing protein [Ferrimonas sp. SCSIO 43195]USD38071.1 DUF3131 domain-containing protein [Ferrimonas sp. SCSIO 43195]